MDLEAYVMCIVAKIRVKYGNDKRFSHLITRHPSDIRFTMINGKMELAMIAWNDWDSFVFTNHNIYFDPYEEPPRKPKRQFIENFGSIEDFISK